MLETQITSNRRSDSHSFHQSSINYNDNNNNNNNNSSSSRSSSSKAMRLPSTSCLTPPHTATAARYRRHPKAA